jgi:Fe-S-cluster-containing hydrogenase component 2/CRP-like cAMP-binding protein
VDVREVASRLFATNFDLDSWLDQQGIPGPVLDMGKEAAGREYAYGQEMRETLAFYGDEYSRKFLAPDAFLVPVPHPKVHVDARETCLRDYIANGMSIGRQKGMPLWLEHSSVSRLHAEIMVRDGEYLLRDKGSSNGTFINGTRMAGDTVCQLRNNDRVRFGDVQFRFELRPQAAARTASAGTIAAGTPKLQRLGEERVQFEIDMCIGCNRCMDVCPVPMSSQVFIADLNTATTSDRVASHVAHFTHECILCGSCVPVCPVDNHRDLLMLSLKERLGVSWNSNPDMNRVIAALPAGWTVTMLVSRLREQPFLRDPQQVPDIYLLHMLAASQQSIVAPGEMILREGEYGRDLYLVLEGLLELTATDADNQALPVAVLRRGEYAGEDGMLTGLPYKASARAQTTALLLQVPEQVMQRLMELVPGVLQHFEHFNNARSLASILKRMALFAGIADADIESLVRQTPVKQYERNQQLFTEDRRGRPSRETMHILLEGFVKVARHAEVRPAQSTGDERILAYRQGGDYFAGGLDLLGDGHAATVTTINRCRVAEVPRHVLLALFQHYPEVDHRFSLRLREYIETAVATQGYAVATGALRHFTPTIGPADPNVQAGLHSLVKDGVVEGTEVLVIDLDKCIHCNECEEACERRHGHSRMNRKGMVVGNISIATACRQCHDPVCMLCSRAGIARHPNGEVYITESCIGCGICAERCPYGAISIVQLEDETAARSSWQRFSEIFTKGAGKERTRKSLPMVSVQAAGGSYAAPGPLDMPRPHGGYDEMRKKVAIKCDLCAGYSDQACVQACPTGAAIRVQPIKFFGSTEEILRKRAN